MKKHIYIGTSGWTYADWSDLFYPKDLPKNQWLEYYTTQFNTLELNATFYRTFPEKVFKSWYKRTPENFHFVVKASRYITHRKYLLDVTPAIERFEKSIRPLKEKASLILLQLPPRMPYHPERLQAALAAFSDASRVVVEFRNKAWLTEEVLAILIKFKAIFCNVDSPAIQIYDKVTSDIAYLRLHGQKALYDDNYTARQLKKFAASIEHLLQQGAKKVYVFFNNDYHAYAPTNAKQLKKILSKNINNIGKE
ncbi:MAG TPA: DUF72 domain-containing protein [Gammaproteobacteria bacterium]|nr:DUF72 domain-containing protein [Gammaproteobacteria bacterium]